MQETNRLLLVILLFSRDKLVKLPRRGAGWSSLAARRAHNPKVVGSNPAPATNLRADWQGAGECD